MIPKEIFQTWKTQILHKKIQKLRNNFLKINNGYTLTLYTDEQMNEFVFYNYDIDIFKHFDSIKNIVAKTDFWRYLILYKKGGIYLDIDSSIEKDLSILIDKNDDAVISAEKNKNCFVQWALIFNKNHPILESTIELLINNLLNNRFKNDVLNFSAKPYWDSVNKYLRINSVNFEWRDINNKTNEIISENNLNTRVFGIDYNGYFKFKHQYNHLLRDTKKGTFDLNHWSVLQKKQNIF